MPKYFWSSFVCHGKLLLFLFFYILLHWSMRTVQCVEEIIDFTLCKDGFAGTCYVQGSPS